MAHCFKKNDEGKLEEVFVIEPLSATSLECMANGARCWRPPPMADGASSCAHFTRLAGRIS